MTFNGLHPFTKQVTILYYDKKMPVEKIRYYLSTTMSSTHIKANVDFATVKLLLVGNYFFFKTVKPYKTVTDYLNSLPRNKFKS